MSRVAYLPLALGLVLMTTFPSIESSKASAVGPGCYRHAESPLVLGRKAEVLTRLHFSLHRIYQSRIIHLREATCQAYVAQRARRFYLKDFLRRKRQLFFFTRRLWYLIAYRKRCRRLSMRTSLVAGTVKNSLRIVIEIRAQHGVLSRRAAKLRRQVRRLRNHLNRAACRYRLVRLQGHLRDMERRVRVYRRFLALSLRRLKLRRRRHIYLLALHRRACKKTVSLVLLRRLTTAQKMMRRHISGIRRRLARASKNLRIRLRYGLKVRRATTITYRQLNIASRDLLRLKRRLCIRGLKKRLACRYKAKRVQRPMTIVQGALRRVKRVGRCGRRRKRRSAKHKKKHKKHKKKKHKKHKKKHKKHKKKKHKKHKKHKKPHKKGKHKG